MTTLKTTTARFRIHLRAADTTNAADFVIMDRVADRFFRISAEKLFQDNDQMRGPPPAHLLQIEGMKLKFFIKLTGYNIANPTSEYTIIKIEKDEKNSNSNDLPILIEEEKVDPANGVPAVVDGAEKKKDIAHEAEKNEEETPQMQEKEASTYSGAKWDTNGDKATTMDGLTAVVDGAGSEKNQKKRKHGVVSDDDE